MFESPFHIGSGAVWREGSCPRPLPLGAEGWACRCARMSLWRTALQQNGRSVSGGFGFAQRASGSILTSSNVLHHVVRGCQQAKALERGTEGAVAALVRRFMLKGEGRWCGHCFCAVEAGDQSNLRTRPLPLPAHPTLATRQTTKAVTNSTASGPASPVIRTGSTSSAIRCVRAQPAGSEEKSLSQTGGSRDLNTLWQRGRTLSADLLRSESCCQGSTDRTRSLDQTHHAPKQVELPRCWCKSTTCSNHLGRITACRFRQPATSTALIGETCRKPDIALGRACCRTRHWPPDPDQTAAASLGCLLPRRRLSQRPAGWLEKAPHLRSRKRKERLWISRSDMAPPAAVTATAAAETDASAAPRGKLPLLPKKVVITPERRWVLFCWCPAARSRPRFIQQAVGLHCTAVSCLCMRKLHCTSPAGS